MARIINHCIKVAVEELEEKVIKWKINYDKCIQCGNCVKACPANVFKYEQENVYIDYGMICIDCLHCAAACPKQAVEFKEPVEGKSLIFTHEEVRRDDFLSKNIEEHILSRRSYRRFNNEPVSKKEILHALNIASWAPSAKNEHPTNWIIIEDKNILNKIMDYIIEYVERTGDCKEIKKLYDLGKNPVMGTASTIIVGYAPRDATNPFADTILALHSAELVLQSHGIGTCWSGYFVSMCNKIKDIMELLRIPEKHMVYGALLVGNVDDEKYINIPNRLKDIKVNWR